MWCFSTSKHMTTRCSIEHQPATPEYVLAVIVDEHRQQSRWDPEAQPEAVLTMQSSIAQWREACDLLPWRKLGYVLNQSWSIDCSDEEWQ
jgi:hypothetical protein